MEHGFVSLINYELPQNFHASHYFVYNSWNIIFKKEQNNEIYIT